MSSGGQRAPEYPQMTNEERQLLFEQGESLRQMRNVLGEQWEAEKPFIQPQQQLRNYQLMGQRGQLESMLGMWPQIQNYNQGAMQGMQEQQNLQRQLLGLQSGYAPQQYQTAEQLLGLQRESMGNYANWMPQLVGQMNEAGRGSTDMPTEASDYWGRSAFMPEQAGMQQQLERALHQRTMDALAGNLPVDPAMERSLQEQQQRMQEQMLRQLGPGWETSSAGIEAAQNFGKRAEELRYQQRNNMLQQAATLGQAQAGTSLQSMLGNQQLAQARAQAMGLNLANRGQDIANTGNRGQSLMNMLTAPMGFQMAQPSLMGAGSLGGLMDLSQGTSYQPGQIKFDPGTYGQLAQGFGSMTEPYAQQRQGSFNSGLANWQASRGGSTFGSVLGGLGGTLAGSFLGPFGSTLGGMAGNWFGGLF